MLLLPLDQPQAQAQLRHGRLVEVVMVFEESPLLHQFKRLIEIPMWIPMYRVRHHHHRHHLHRLPAVITRATPIE